MGPWPIIPANFDGEKFATRYGLNALQFDFWVQPVPPSSYQLHLKPNITIADDPPIIDPPDPQNIVNQKAAKQTLAAQSHPGVTLRAVALTLLDLINNTRQQMTPPLPQITRQQFTTFLQNKIDSGSADT